MIETSRSISYLTLRAILRRMVALFERASQRRNHWPPTPARCDADIVKR